jgi:hypothetical protein
MPEDEPPASTDVTDSGSRGGKVKSVTIFIAGITALIAGITALIAAVAGLITSPDLSKIFEKLDFWKTAQVDLTDDRQVEKAFLGIWEGYIADGDGTCTYSWEFRNGDCECKADYFNIIQKAHHIWHAASGWHVAKDTFYTHPDMRVFPDHNPAFPAGPFPQPFMTAITGAKKILSLSGDKLEFQIPNFAGNYTMTRKR